MSFTSQNYGVGKLKRMDRVLRDCIILSVSVSLALGVGVYVFGPEILQIYTTDPAVIQCAMEILLYTTVTYFFWSYGSVSGSIAWNGTFSSTDDSVRDRNGRYPYCLDLWYFPTAQVIGDLVYLLSGILDPYDRDAGDLLLLRAAACTPHPCGTAFMSK